MFARAAERVSSSANRGATRRELTAAGRTVCFASLVAVTLVAFWAPLSMLAPFSFRHEHYSHIILIPLVSGSLLVLGRERIFAHCETHWRLGMGLLTAGALSYWFGQGHWAAASANDQLSVAIFALVVTWVSAFVLCYGMRALQRGLFPLLFLFLMVPIPDGVLSRAIFVLQTGSAEVANSLFEVVGVPVLRTGFTFALPGVTIEVAKECSGIRSSLVLLITSLLAGHLFLRSAWTRGVLALATVPLLIVKNGIRIATLSLLSVYVDPRFLTGSLHRDGGIVFFLLALAILTPVLWILQRSEASQAHAAATKHGVTASRSR